MQSAPGLVHLVALGVGEVGDDGGDGVGGGALEGVDPEKELGELVVGVAGDGLDQEHVLVTNGLVDTDEQVALGEHDGFGVAQLCAQIRAHALGKGTAGHAGVDSDDARSAEHISLPQNMKLSWKHV